MLFTYPDAQPVIAVMFAFFGNCGLVSGWFIGRQLFGEQMKQEKKQRDEIKEWFKERFGEPLQKL